MEIIQFQENHPIVWDTISNFSLSLLLTILEATLGFKAPRGLTLAFTLSRSKAMTTRCNLKEMKSSQKVKTNCCKKTSIRHFKCLKFRRLAKINSNNNYSIDETLNTQRALSKMNPTQFCST